MEYKEFAINIAKEAGDIMHKNFQLGMKKEWKADNSPVTETDIAINKLVINKVKEYFPDHDVKGEEESDLGNNSEYLWVCDPVDGTIPFSHGFPIFTFSLALVKNGRSILGVVYDPIMQNLYWAEKGKGAFLNNKPIHISNHSTINQSCIALENFKRAKYSLWGIERELDKQGGQVIKLCSIIYPSSRVASGEISAAIFPHTTAHDIAAIKIIVEEAGGKVTDLFGDEQRYDQDINGAIISNGKIHDLLVKEVAKALKNEPS